MSENNGTAAMGAPPRRRVVCKIEIGADSWREMANALDAIAFRIWEANEKNEQQVSVVNGGPTAGWTLEGDEDMTISHETYIDGIEAWLAERRRGRDEQ